MSDIQMVRGVVLDLDGTMFDTEALFFRVASEMLRDRGKVFTPEIMRAMIGRQPAESALALQTMSGIDEPPEALMAEAIGRFEARIDSGVQPMPGLLFLLDHLQDLGLPFAVGTSAGRTYAHRIFRNHGLLERFRFTLCREDVTRHKPDPEIYRTAASRLGFEPAEVLVLEDSPTGLTAARAAGTFAVGVPHEYSPEPGIAQIADLIVRSLDDPALLERIAVGRAR